MSWHHHNPVAVRRVDDAMRALIDHAPPGPLLLVTTAGGTRRGWSAAATTALGIQRVTVIDSITPNPTIEALDPLADALRGQPPAGIIAIGGGSVIDAAKVLSVLLPSGARLHETLIGGGAQAWSRAVPLVAVPTTAGTGSEVTPFATVWHAAARKKHSVVGDAVYPRVALLDASLTASLPREITLHTALDATSHALESLWNVHRTPLSTTFALRALSLLARGLPAALATGDDLDARTDLQDASLLAGMAISQTRTAVAHAISYPLTAHYDVPHGLACSFTLIALIDRQLARADLDADRASAFARTRAMLAALDLPAELARYVGADAVLALREQMVDPSRAGNFDLSLTGAELSALLVQSLQRPPEISRD